MNSMKKTLVLLLALWFASLLSACGGASETTLSGAEQEAVLKYSEAKTDQLVAGMNAGDYAAFSKDFDQAMLTAINESEFAKLKQDRDARLGAYVSRQVNKVTLSPSGKYMAVIYDTVFEKEDAVTMRVVFHVDDPHEISGLWFNK